MTVSDARTLIHVSNTVVEVEVVIAHVLEKFESHEKRQLTELLVEDNAIETIHALGEFSQKLTSVNLAIGLLQSYGVRI